MKPLKILIVEDEYVTIKGLTTALTDMGYEVVADATSAKEAIGILEKQEIDLAILDINIKGEKDGIWLADYMNNTVGIPFIFLTAFADQSTVEKAIDVKPYGYLVKPFQRTDIYASIELAIANYQSQKVVKEPSNTTDGKIKNAIFIKDDYTYIKLNLEEVLYIESNKNYLDIYTKSKEYKTRSTIKNFIPGLPANFVQCHRGFIVNTEKVNQVSKNFLMVGGSEVPYSANYKNDLLKRLELR